MLNAELCKKFALLPPESRANANGANAPSSETADLNSRTATTTAVPTESAISVTSASSSTFTLNRTATQARKPKEEDVLIAPYYKALVHAGLEKEDAAEQVEQALLELLQAQEHLRQARERDRAADTQVATAAESLKSKHYKWSRHDTQWVGMYRELLKHKETHGHCLVSSKDGALGKWVCSQRQSYRARQKNKSSGMTQARLDLLNAVGFDWGTPLPERVPWDERYRDLLAFRDKFGHCNVTQRTEYHRLALWVARQRRAYQQMLDGKPEDFLTEERIRLLEEAGIEWRRHKFKNRGKKRKAAEEEEKELSTILMDETTEFEPFL